MWTARIYLVDPETGDKQDRTTLVKLVAGAIYGLGIFVLLLPRICRKTPAPAAKHTPSSPGNEPDAARSIDERLAELKQLHEDELITTAEYDQKKAEILREL